MADIDIDFPSSFDPVKIFKQATPASMIKEGMLVKHPCGHYFQNISIDPITNISAIPYEEAEILGYFKIDFLHLYVLDLMVSKQEVRNLLKQPPDWKLLTDETVVTKLFQLHKHAKLLNVIRPTSIQELADCVALIRPKKRIYLDSYISNRIQTRPFLYRSEDDDKSSFRRSHAIAYAATIVLQLHLIKQGRL